MKESVTVVVMAYNEAGTLRPAVEEALAAVRPLGRPFEILIIDDGSTDATGQIAEDLGTDYEQVRVVHHSPNKGMGGVYRTAFREARNDILYIMAADLQPVPSEYFKTFLPRFEDSDIVLGIEKECRASLLSKFFSWGEKILFAILFPGVPKIGGPLMLRRRVLQQVELRLLSDEQDRSWMILWELMIRARRQGSCFALVPVQRRERAVSTSRGNMWRNAFSQLRAALAFRLRL